VTQARPPSSSRVEITLRYFSGCPSWQLAEARLREALAIVGQPDAVVTLEEVNTPEDAVRLGFTGSPSILLDGRDPFADDSAPAGLACRVYATADGLQGAPTTLQLVRALS